TVVASTCAAGVVAPSSYVVPTTAHVSYLVNGNPVVSGSTRSGSFPTVETLSAVADTGFVLASAFSVPMVFLVDHAGCTPASGTAPVVANSVCSGGVA